MSKMEWCIENIESQRLMELQSELHGDRIVIFDSPEQAEEFIKEFNFDMTDGAIVQRIIYGPKVSCENARAELYEE